MPLAKIHVLEGQYDKARLDKVSHAVQHGLISALGIPPEDFFQIIHVSRSWKADPSRRSRAWGHLKIPASCKRPSSTSRRRSAVTAFRA
jgi:hypothetical protein